MPLDGDAMNQLIGDAIDGKDRPSIKGKEAKVFFDKVKKQVTEMLAKGQAPQMLQN